MLARAYSGVRRQWMGALALFLVLAGGGAVAAFDPVGGDGDIDACFQKRSGDLDIQKGRKCGKREKRVAWAQIGPQGAPGPQGDPGTQGPPGADATNLFAFVGENFPGPDAQTASIRYGEGVTSVSDPAGHSQYVVTFDRSLAGCVVHATAGVGTSPGEADAFLGLVPIVRVHPSGSGSGTASVRFDAANGTGVADSSFLITAFC